MLQGVFRLKGLERLNALILRAILLVVAMLLKVGTCGFQRSRRASYEYLDVVEVQQTFYEPPPRDTLSKWREEAPPGFEFTVKAWMLVTHGYSPRLWRRMKNPPGSPEDYEPFKLSDPVVDAWNRTLEAARSLGASKIIIQTPPSFKATRGNEERIVEFLRSVERGGVDVIWEPRGDWWLDMSAMTRVASRAEIHLSGDPLNGRMPPVIGGLLYSRLHGIGPREVNYRYNYTEADLKRLAELVKGSGAERSYILFNNIYSFNNAVAFKRIAGEALNL